MLILTVDRLGITDKQSVDIALAHVCFVGDFVAADDKELRKNTCVIALSNGVVMHVAISRDKLKKMMEGYK